MTSMIEWKDYLKSIGNDDVEPVVPHEIYLAMSSIEFYTNTIKALLKVGWSYSGTDGVIDMFHNDRAIDIAKVENYDNHKYLVKFWKDGSIHLYLRKEYMRNKYGKGGRR